MPEVTTMAEVTVELDNAEIWQLLQQLSPLDKAKLLLRAANGATDDELRELQAYSAMGYGEYVSLCQAYVERLLKVKNEKAD